jgi:hypothetical protein
MRFELAPDITRAMATEANSMGLSDVAARLMSGEISAENIKAGSLGLTQEQAGSILAAGREAFHALARQ